MPRRKRESDMLATGDRVSNSKRGRGTILKVGFDGYHVAWDKSGKTEVCQRDELTHITEE